MKEDKVLKKYKRLEESSLSRIWQHVEDDETSFAVISAYRGIYSEADNLKRHNELKGKIRAMGYGYIEQKSGYSYSNPEEGEDVSVEEKSFFIPNIDFKSAINLGRLFKQESILCELPKAKASGLLASTSLLFSKFKRIFKKSYILSTSVNSLCTTGTKLKKFYDRKVFSICQLPTFKKFQRTNLIVSTLKLKGFFVKKYSNFFLKKFALYSNPKDMGFTAYLYKDKEKGFGLFMCDTGKLEMLFKRKDKLFSFNKDDIKQAYSQLVKSNNNQRKMKFAYVAERFIPSRTDAMLGMKEHKIPEARWIKIV